MRLNIIVFVTGMPRLYVRATRLNILAGEVYVLVWPTNKSRLAIAYEKAREHAYWLVGDKAPHQAEN
jgi:hypothetical protein